MSQRYSFQGRIQQLFQEGETQEQFAARVGLSRNTVAAYCKGNRTTPDADVLRKICTACNVSADWLLGLSEIKSPDFQMQGVCEYTGMSELVVETLHAGLFFPRKKRSLPTPSPEKSMHRKIINTILNELLCTTEGYYFMHDLYKYLNLEKKPDVYIIDEIKWSVDEQKNNDAICPLKDEYMEKGMACYRTKDGSYEIINGWNIPYMLLHSMNELLTKMRANYIQKEGDTDGKS